MPEFRYTARDKSGQAVSDTIAASSRDAAGEALHAQGLLPTSIQEKGGAVFTMESLNFVFARVSLLEKITFIKNLSVTVRAGLPISRALHVVTEQMPNAYFRKITGEISRNVEAGQTLSGSMARYPKVFSPIFVNMVKVGEQSGELEKTLDYLSRQIGRDYELLKRTRGALLYPAVVMSALLIIGYIMFTFVLPKMTETFKEFEVELPLLTKAIIGVVDLFANYVALTLIAAFAGIFGLVIWHRSQSGRRFFHWVNLSLPVVGQITRKMNLARFTMIFSGLLKSGMPIVEALKISGDTMTNVYYQEAITDAAEKVRTGVDLRVALEKYPKLFTPMVTQMIQVGEESGTVDNVLEEVSRFYESEIDDSVKNLSSIIEPLLVIVIGAVVGVLAVGLILPIYNIGTGI